MCLAGLNLLVRFQQQPFTTQTGLKRPITSLQRGGWEDLTKFLAAFKETTMKYSYPDFDKFILLKQQLSGRALILIDSLETRNQTYNEAKDLLTSAFASREVQVFKSIKNLTKIKLRTNNDPYNYISKMRNLIELVSSLNITSEHFLQIFFWNGLNETFQNQIIQICNKTRPTLADISNNFFEALERYSNVIKSRKGEIKHEPIKKKSVVAMAVDVQPNLEMKNKKRNVIFAILQVAKVSKCNVNSTPKSKVVMLRKLNGCLKCELKTCKLNHQIEFCKF